MGPVELDMIAALARKPKVKAIGEIGLDFHYNHSHPDVQRDCFRIDERLTGRRHAQINHISLPQAMRGLNRHTVYQHLV
jgi:Tat protein secretion system quality control protein TatD with DNase activity